MTVWGVISREGGCCLPPSCRLPSRSGEAVPKFYRSPKSGNPISQGDLFVGVPRIGVSLQPLFRGVQQADGNTYVAESLEPDQLSDGMHVIEQVKLTAAIVISQSCDAEHAPCLMLAPVTDFSVTGKGNESKWKKINYAATSLQETKLVYLPGNPTLQLQRSVANFSQAFTLPRLFLEKMEQKGMRKASLGKTAVEYLQFRLGVMLTRVAQDDYAWPSREDIELKIAYLKDEEKERGKKVEKAQEELEKARANGGDTESAQVILDGKRGELEDYKKQIAVAEAALANADEVED